MLLNIIFFEYYTKREYVYICNTKNTTNVSSAKSDSMTPN
jgi:hypothetical protein